ncbi:MAG: hypothetical protein E7281_05770 [Lachnospiraceae bacterium]|nr:hypothetical protein [Lachnospiraceae bacterium]
MEYTFKPNLSDEDILKIISSERVENIIRPIKTHNKHYQQYVPRLGNMRADSTLVKRNLGNVVLTLYKKNDQAYGKMVPNLIKKYGDDFKEIILDYLGPNDNGELFDVDEFHGLTFEQMKYAITNYLEENNSIDIDLLFAQIKCGCFSLNDKEVIEIKELVKKYGRGTDKDNSLKESNNEYDKNYLADTILDETEEADYRESIQKEKKITSKKRGKTAEEKAMQSKAIRKKRNKEAEEKKRIAEDSINGELLDVDDEIIAQEKELNFMRETNTFMIGKINIDNRTYYNFTPIGKIEGDVFNPYRESDIEELLPKSKRGNVNLFYRSNDVEFMADNFHENQLVIFEYDKDSLLENRQANGELNPTGYKVSAKEAIASGKIRPICKEGFYSIYMQDVLEDGASINTTRILKLKYDGIFDGDEIFINMGDGFYAGPFEVSFKKTLMSYAINTALSENKYTLKGFESKQCKRIEIFEEPDPYEERKNTWYVYRVIDGEEQQYKDVITDKELLNSISDMLSQESVDVINVNELTSLVQKYNESVVGGCAITPEIKEARLKRIETLLSSGEGFKNYYDAISDIVYKTLLSDQDDVQAQQIIEAIISKPEISEKLQNTKIARDRADDIRAEIVELYQEKEELLKEVEDARNTVQAAFEEQAKSTLTDLQIQGKNKELQELEAKVDVAKNIDELQKQAELLKNEVEYYESHREHLKSDSKDLESKFVNLINSYSEKVVDITFDGYMSSKMIKAAAEWENAGEARELSEYVLKVNNIDGVDMEPDELIAYMTRLVRIVRPQYTQNDIVNILTCMMQGFITVFSGAPGCGKTSICNIVANVLGLNRIADTIGDKDKLSNRYIPVSVERGWTSKRDFIGYYNPLTKMFEESNRNVFDGLRVLDIEKKTEKTKFPFLILLDEANLSPMEYYWADFMNVCDDLNNNNINLGNKNIFEIPETLHFLATINNDFTTESLSPRLIDRAWVISLPRVTRLDFVSEIPDNEISIVTWDSLKRAFHVPKGENPSFTSTSKRIYDGLKDLYINEGVNVSPRVDAAIYNYCFAASKLMIEDDLKRDTATIALDYAISQKLIPKIAGSGEEYEAWLESIREYCSHNNLNQSSSIIGEIIERGNKQMKYYQYFS